MIDRELGELISSNEDPEEIFELIDLIGTQIFLHIILYKLRVWLIWTCL